MREHQSARAPLSTHSDDPTPCKVLLIEEDPNDARAATGLLQASVLPRFDVVHVATMADALARLARPSPIDVILTDLGLPDRQGLDVVRELRASAPDLPLLVLTGNEDDSLPSLAVAAGAQDYLRKRTVQSQELARAIVLARARETRAAAIESASRATAHSSVARTESLASVSHEIRTPLNTILGMAELLGETRLLPEQARYLATLQRAGEHLLSLVNDVLDLSRIEADGLTLERSPFDLFRVTDSAVDFLRPAARAKGIELRVERAPFLPRMVLGDARRFRQVLVNLLANGVKFTSKGAVRLTVTPDRSQHVPGALRIGVEDTGIGIAADRIGDIFGSFVQSDPSIARQYGGSGLGLSIVKRLVDLMGGRITASSTVGVGRRFEVQLAFEAATVDDQASHDDAAPATALALPSEPAPRGGELAGLCVLLVDDSEEGRVLVEAFLAPTGATLELAADASSALAKLRDARFDVVLMDLHLPGIDGFAAARAVRRLEKASASPPTTIVALSADALPETVARVLAEGFDGHLAKPIRKARLLSLLRRSGSSEEARPAPAPSPTVAALLPRFLAHRQRDVVAIRDALTRHDFDAVATLGHNMQGNGVSYGVPEVSVIGKRLESAARKRDPRIIEQQAGKLEECIALVQSEETRNRARDSR